MRLPDYLTRLLPRNLAPWQAFFMRAAISALAFAALYQFSNLGKAAKFVMHADLLPVMAALALLVLCVPILAWRWQIILGKLEARIGLGTLIQVFYVSTFVGFVFPSANGSDLVRGAMLKRPDNPLGAIVGSIVIDRLYGLAAMAFLALPGAAIFLLTGRAFVAVEAVAAGSGVLVAATVVLLTALPYVASRLCLRSQESGGVLRRIAT